MSNKNLVLYYSATGNSLEAAKNIGKQLENPYTINLLTIDDSFDFNLYHTIGFIFPSYFFSIPKFVLEKIKSFNLKKDIYYYGICTMKMMDGNARMQLKKILLEKGIKLSYYSSVKMVGTYILLYNVPPQKKSESILKNARIKCEEIANNIKNRKEIKITPKLPIISKISYLIYQKKIRNSNIHFSVNESCNGCGICAKACPFNNIKLVENKPVWGTNCYQCTACIHWCPTQAINYGKITKSRRRYTNPKIHLNEMQK